MSLSSSSWAEARATWGDGQQTQRDSKTQSRGGAERAGPGKDQRKQGQAACRWAAHLDVAALHGQVEARALVAHKVEGHLQGGQQRVEERMWADLAAMHSSAACLMPDHDGPCLMRPMRLPTSGKPFCCR